MPDAISGEETTIRRLTLADAPTLLELWNRSARYDPIDAALLDEKIWQDPDYDPRLALACSLGDRLTGFVVAVTRRAVSGGNAKGYIKLLAVDPDFHGSGIGARLLSEAERGLSRKGARTVRVGESAPNYLAPGVDLRNEIALAFFARNGYDPLARACNLRVDLLDLDCEDAAERARLQSQGIGFRRVTTKDRPALMSLVGRFGGSWTAEVSRSMKHMPPLVHIAERNGSLLGFSACEGNNVGTGWFGPMGTIEQARGLGIGRVLLLRCLADLGTLGFPSAIIPWVGPVEFYARHAGAVIDRQFQRFEKELQP